MSISAKSDENPRISITKRDLSQQIEKWTGSLFQLRDTDASILRVKPSEIVRIDLPDTINSTEICELISFEGDEIDPNVWDACYELDWLSDFDIDECSSIPRGQVQRAIFVKRGSEQGIVFGFPGDKQPHFFIGSGSYNFVEIEEKFWDCTLVATFWWYTEGGVISWDGSSYLFQVGKNLISFDTGDPSDEEVIWSARAKANLVMDLSLWLTEKQAVLAFILQYVTPKWLDSDQIADYDELRESVNDFYGISLNIDTDQTSALEAKFAKSGFREYIEALQGDGSNSELLLALLTTSAELGSAHILLSQH